MRRFSPEQMNAIRRLRCPRCFHGRVFSGAITMYENCPECGLVYNREQGFFLGALYIAYGLGIPILLGAMWLTALTLQRPFFDSFWHSLVLFVPLTLWIFRYSRVIWMHLVEHLDPLPGNSEFKLRR